MKGNVWLFIFIADLFTDLLSIYYKWDNVRYITKPLIVILLLIYCVQVAKRKLKSISFLLTALLFSLAGDIFLLFDSKNPNLFIFGLVSFLIAHVFYILLFLQIKKISQPLQKPYWWLVLLVSIYTISLFLILSPALGSLKIPVLIYASVLSIMFLSSAHAFNILQPAGKLCITGAGLFVISDSLLAINKFYHSFAFAGLLVMLTYSFAQLFIVLGVLRHKWRSWSELFY
jgi:uncharacterized membrane protein YhhN